MPTWYDVRKNMDLRELGEVTDLRTHAIQSQYSASERILRLANGFQEQLDPSADIDRFYESIFDIRTATGVGLDNWGRILGIGRVILEEESREAITLDDESYRLLLMYKALANISPADAATLNKLLQVLMETGIGGFDAPAYVLETGPMVIRWVFEDFLTKMQLAVFKSAGTLAKGAGVGWEMYAINPKEVLGFAGSQMQPFNQAPFAPDSSLAVEQ